MSEAEQKPATDPPAENEAATKTGKEEGAEGEGEVKGDTTADAEGIHTPFYLTHYLFSLVYQCLSIVYRSVNGIRIISRYSDNQFVH